jgi:hypothetical protein
MVVFEMVEDHQKGVAVVLQPRDTPLLGSTRYIAHQAKIWQDNTLTDYICLIVLMIPM